MFEEYTTEELNKGLDIVKQFLSDTGDSFYLNMAMKIVEELSKREQPNR